MWWAIINQPVLQLLNLFTEELLIDFCELIGSHSGENLAAAIWETLELYGLQGHASTSTKYHSICYGNCCERTFICWLSAQVIAINCDNALNNDTMMEALERLNEIHGFDFDAQESRLWCMPHTIHLAAMEASRKTLGTYLQAKL